VRVLAIEAGEVHQRYRDLGAQGRHEPASWWVIPQPTGSYGEFGVMEPAAVLDVIGVAPVFRGRHVASALIDQLRTNLLGLGIGRLQTEVPWDNPDLLAFFQRERFVVAQRVCLDLDLARTRD
jgi:GNAT superfamily N-acetyltransferase